VAEGATGHHESALAFPDRAVQQNGAVVAFSAAGRQFGTQKEEQPRPLGGKRPGTVEKGGSYCVTAPVRTMVKANPGSSPLPGVVAFCASRTSFANTLRVTAPVGF